MQKDYVWLSPAMQTR